MDERMLAQMENKGGFIAALDESGGSTPGSLKRYGIPETAYSGDAEMFSLMHQMRTRVMTAPAFTGESVIGAILFEQTMVGEVQGRKVPEYLWEERGVVPFLKIDKGTEATADGVKLLKAIPSLDEDCKRAVSLGIFGTKMRSVIEQADPKGVAAIVAQQFEVGARIAGHGLVPILEPEVLIGCPDKAEAEEMLLAEITKHLDGMAKGSRIMLKLTIPEVENHYAPVIAHAGVIRVVALSGGYPQAEACARLARNHGMIASFSRALVEGLTRDMDDAAFDRTIGGSIERIRDASLN